MTQLPTIHSNHRGLLVAAKRSRSRDEPADFNPVPNSLMHPWYGRLAHEARELCAVPSTRVTAKGIRRAVECIVEDGDVLFGAHISTA